MQQCLEIVVNKNDRWKVALKFSTRDPTAISASTSSGSALILHAHQHPSQLSHLSHSSSNGSLIFLASASTASNANTNCRWIWKLAPILSLSFINPIILCAHQHLSHLSCICHINQAEAWRLLWTMRFILRFQFLCNYHICQIITGMRGIKIIKNRPYLLRFGLCGNDINHIMVLILFCKKKISLLMVVVQKG